MQNSSLLFILSFGAAVYILYLQIADFEQQDLSMTVSLV